MNNQKIINQLEDLRSEVEYQLAYDPNNEVWINDYNALDKAIKIIKNGKSFDGFWVGVGFCSLFWLLMYFLYHL